MLVVMGRNEVAEALGEDCHVGERMGVKLGLEGWLETVAVSGTKVWTCCPRDWEKAGIESSSTSAPGDCATTVETASSSNETPTRNCCDIDINDDGMMDIYATIITKTDSSLDSKPISLGPAFISGFPREKLCPELMPPGEIFRRKNSKKREGSGQGLRPSCPVIQCQNQPYVYISCVYI